MDRGKQLSVPGDPNDERALNSDERVGRAGLFSQDQPQLEVAIFFRFRMWLHFVNFPLRIASC